MREWVRLRTIFTLFLYFSLISALSGCQFGTRFVFSSSRDIQMTPEQVGLRYEDVHFPTQDGLELHGWFIPGAPGKPLVVFFHGNAANISHRVPLLSYLNQFGMSIFIFDYRGYGQSQGRPLYEEDIYLDSRAALKWLQGRGWSIEKMIFYGRSMGASAALQMALEYPPAELVLEGAFTSLADIARETTPAVYYLFGWWGIGDQFHNLNKVKDLTTSLMIFHGESDTVVPLAMGQQLFSSAPLPKKFLLVRGAGHSNAFEVGGQPYRKAWEKIASKLSQTSL